MFRREVIHVSRIDKHHDSFDTIKKRGKFIIQHCQPFPVPGDEKHKIIQACDL